MTAIQTLTRALKRNVKPGWRFLGDQLRRIDHRFYYKPRLTWWRDIAWADEFRPWIERDGRQGTRLLDRRLVLVEMARAVQRLTGSTAECGVAGGVGSALICKALLSSYRCDDLHLAFDSFEGLPEPNEVDRMANGRHHWYQGKLHHDVDEVSRFLSPFAVCRTVKGWIPHTFGPFENRSFRLVHIDVDLYQPTLDTLRFFYERVVPGGVIVLDDHGFLDCPGARAAALEFFADKPEPLIELPTGQAFAFRA